MTIQINWDNPYGGIETEFRIYRDTNPINPLSPPAILATTPTGSSSYIDSSVSTGTTYYYRVSVVINTQEVFGSADEVVTVGEFTPLDLFQVGDLGFWLDACDANTFEHGNNPIFGVDGQIADRHFVKGPLATFDPDFNLFGNFRLSKKSNGRICNVYTASRNYEPNFQSDSPSLNTTNHNPADFTLFNNCNEILMGFNFRGHSSKFQCLYSIRSANGNIRFLISSLRDGAKLIILGRQLASDSLGSFIIRSNTTQNFNFDMENHSLIVHWKAQNGSEVDIYINGVLLDSGTFNATVSSAFENISEEDIYIGSEIGSSGTFNEMGYGQIIHCGRIGSFTNSEIESLSNFLLNSKYRGL